uniref:Uncharacterized protein n=1 Tax=Phytophthora ramorum TaxID=164328 RepID=H3H4R5_PHYRM
MKAALCVNKFSENLEVLDYVAAAIINGSPDPEQAFCRPVMILPRSERQRFGVESTTAVLTDQKSEAPPAKRNSPPSSHASEGEAVLSRKAKTVACTVNTLRSTEAKELTTVGGVSGRIGQTGGTVVNAAATPELKLSAKTPVTVLGDLQQMYHEANAEGVFPYEKAYPWEGVYLWYDPADYEDVYLAHWRFWNLHRPVFFDWALHVPHASGAMLAARRKKKMAAGRARQEFVSLCIERWGWYGFLRMLEFTGNRHLMWWGGQPGRNSSKGKAYTGGHVVDLGELCKKDEGAYKAKISGALKPFRLDEGAFANLPELLEQTDALDPSLVPFN